MNAVSLVGTLAIDPMMRASRAGTPECRMKLAVPRRSRGGRPEPGVVYVRVSLFGSDALEHGPRLRQGSRIGLTGRLDSADPRESAGVLIDQLDYL
jgi:single-stranded DNA-binding protein